MWETENVSGSVLIMSVKISYNECVSLQHLEGEGGRQGGEGERGGRGRQATPLLGLRDDLLPSCVHLVHLALEAGGRGAARNTSHTVLGSCNLLSLKCL